jgi:hypothetical protein
VIESRRAQPYSLGSFQTAPTAWQLTLPPDLHNWRAFGQSLVATIVELKSLVASNVGEVCYGFSDGSWRRLNSHSMLDSQLTVRAFTFAAWHVECRDISRSEKPLQSKWQLGVATVE